MNHNNQTQILKKDNQQIRKKRQTNTNTKSNNKIQKQKQYNFVYHDDQKVIGYYQFQTKNQIGTGYSSKVYKAINQKNNLYYAIKTINIKNLQQSNLQMTKNQVKILKKILHPNVLKFQAIQQTKDHLFIITEYCQKGDLSSYLIKKGKENIQQWEALQIFSDLVNGIQYLFKLGIIHRDIKPMNILYDSTNWKLADFGFAIESSSPIYTISNVGTPLYMPLQVLQDNLYSPQSDIFSLGVVLYELIVGVTPWKCRDQDQLIEKMKKQSFKIPINLNISSFTRNIIKRLCQCQRKDRMSKTEFLQLNPMIIKQKSFQLKQKKLANNQNQQVSMQKKDQNIYKKFKYQNSLYKQIQNESYFAFSKIIQKTSKQIISCKSLCNINKNINTINNQNNEEETLADKNNMKKRFKYNTKNNKEQQINQDYNKVKILNLLKCCQFMYYLYKNTGFLELTSRNRQTIKIILLKNAILLFNQIIDSKNWFGLRYFQNCCTNKIYKQLINICKKYSLKYKNQLQNEERKVDYVIIDNLRQNIPQIQIKNYSILNQEKIVIVYQKIISIIKPIIRQNNHNLAMELMTGKQKSLSYSKIQIQEIIKQKIQGLNNLYYYFKLISIMQNNFKILKFQAQFKIQFLQNYFNYQKFTLEDFMQIRQYIKFI